jgi:alpha-1,3-glucosyltransferase
MPARSRSTDFDVHQNWLAITFELPLRQWYFDNRSIWTLDYPPLFAYVEWALSHCMRCVAPELLIVHESEARLVERADVATVYWHRATVILFDIVYYLGSFAFVCTFAPSRKKVNKVNKSDRVDGALLGRFALLLLHPALLLVDHVHFQYNGALLGLLLGAIAAMARRRHVLGAALFWALVNAKHLYAPLTPIVFAYLMAACARRRRRDGRFDWPLFWSIGAAVVAVTVLAWAPLVVDTALHADDGKRLDALGTLGAQVMARLFPFGRGLLHAYWPANAWALYMFADKALAIALGVRQQHGASMTGGLVTDAQGTAVLPNVTPLVSMAFVVVAVALIAWRVFVASAGNKRQLLPRAIVLGALAQFMFGWHVHEKALLTAAVPLVALIYPDNVALLLTLVSTYSVFPLLFEARESPLKYTMLVAYVYAYVRLAAKKWRPSPWLIVYALGFVGIATLNAALPIVAPSLPFLPLLIVSVYCALAALASLIQLAT